MRLFLFAYIFVSCKKDGFYEKSAYLDYNFAIFNFFTLPRGFGRAIGFGQIGNFN